MIAGLENREFDGVIVHHFGRWACNAISNVGTRKRSPKAGGWHQSTRENHAGKATPTPLQAMDPRLAPGPPTPRLARSARTRIAEPQPVPTTSKETGERRPGHRAQPQPTNPGNPSKTRCLGSGPLLDIHDYRHILGT